MSSPLSCRQLAPGKRSVDWLGSVGGRVGRVAEAGCCPPSDSCPAVPAAPPHRGPTALLCLLRQGGGNPRRHGPAHPHDHAPRLQSRWVLCSAVLGCAACTAAALAASLQAGRAACCLLPSRCDACATHIPAVAVYCPHPVKLPSLLSLSLCHPFSRASSHQPTHPSAPAGKFHALVATDVAARGLDIKSIKTVSGSNEGSPVLSLPVSPPCILLHHRPLASCGRLPTYCPPAFVPRTGGQL